MRTLPTFLIVGAMRSGTTSLVRYLGAHPDVYVAPQKEVHFFDLHFEMLDARDVNAIASYGGFPVRYPSWRFGMEFERMEKGRRYGLAKI